MKKNKYLWLWGTWDYLQDSGSTTVGHQGSVNVRYYKGSVIFETQDGNQANTWATAWLDGEDLDKLIKDLKVRSRQWKEAYAKARRKLRSDLRKGRLTPDSRGNTPGGQAMRKKMGYKGRVKGPVNGKITVVK